MATITQHAPGTFCWPELATTHHAAAKKFYGTLFGWGGIDNDMGENGVYTLFTRGGDTVGALYEMKGEERKNAPPHWNSYVSVKSADETAARAQELGAKIFMEPFDVMDLGRMAVIQDPTGAVFCLWQAKNNIGATVLGENGSLVWTELMTGDTAKASAFYTALFPWKTEERPMEKFVYTMFQRGDVGAGGMLPLQHPSIPPHWMPYFGVENCDVSYAKATELGAESIMPVQVIPDMGRFAILKDPEGAVFAIWESNM